MDAPRSRDDSGLNAPPTGSGCASVQDALIADSIVTGSSVTYAAGNADANTAGGAAPNGMSAQIHDSLIKNSSITFNNQHHTHVHGNPAEQARAELRRFVFQMWQQEVRGRCLMPGGEELRNRQERLLRYAKDLKLETWEGQQVIDAFIREIETEWRKTRQNEPLYRMRVYGKEVDEGRKLPLAEVIAQMNKVKYGTGRPEVAKVGGEWVPAWNLPEVLCDPEAVRVCACSGRNLALQEATVCGTCGRIVAATLWQKADGRCPLCQPVAQRAPQLCNDAPADSPDLSARLDTSLWARVPAGEFAMGSPDLEADRDGDERLHRVRLSRDFYVQTVPVTRALYISVAGGTGDGNQPATEVSWHDAVRFCNAYSKKLGLAPCYEITADAGREGGVRWLRHIRGVRLLTEAEWEYACRAGSDAPHGNVAEGALGDYAVFDVEEDDDDVFGPPSVRMRRPNAHGIFDMLGLVWEWVWDAYAPYGAEPIVDPGGDSTGDFKIARGGCFYEGTRYCRCAKRYRRIGSHTSPSLGFRVAVTA